MNREAVALGTPVYTTFQGRLGAVDERLIAEGRLRMLTDPGELTFPPRGRARRRRRGCAATRACSPTCCSLLSWIPSGPAGHAEATESPLAAYNPHNAPTDPLGGPTPPPSLAAAARSGRGAGRARVLPRLPAALRQRPAQALRAAARRRRIWWVLGGKPARAGRSPASTSAAGATPASATTRRSCGPSCCSCC